jgi:hypothetical protein
VNRLHPSCAALAALVLAASACDRPAADLNAPGIPDAVSNAKSITASKSIHENFNLNVKAPSVLEATGTAPSFINGAVTFDPYSRGYLRTIDGDFNTVSFTADIVVTVVSPRHGNGDGITFVGIGDGVPSGWYGEPSSNAAVYARLMPSDFFGPNVEFTTSIGGGTSATYAPGQAGDGTHKVRISWNKSTSEVTISIDSNWVPGTAFTPDATSGPISAAGLFDGTNAHIFFGGAGSATFDDLHVVVAPEK